MPRKDAISIDLIGDEVVISEPHRVGLRVSCPPGKSVPSPEAILCADSLADVDAGPVALKRREGLQGSADRTPEPKPARLGEDHHVAPGHADVEGSDLVTQGGADLAFDPPPRDEVRVWSRVGTGIALGPGLVLGPGIPARRGQRRRRRPEQPAEDAGRSVGEALGRGLIGSSSGSAVPGVPTPGARPLIDRGAAGRAVDPRAFDGSWSRGSMVSGIVSPDGVAVDVPDRDVPAPFEGLRSAGSSERGGGASSVGERGSLSGKPSEPEGDRFGGNPEGSGKASSDGGGARPGGGMGPPIGGRYPTAGRDAGAVTPGIASIGRYSGFGVVGRIASGGAGAAGLGLFGGCAAWGASAFGGSSDGGSSGGGSWAATEPVSPRNRDSDHNVTVTSLDIAGSRLDSSHDARGSKTPRIVSSVAATGGNLLFRRIPA